MKMYEHVRILIACISVFCLGGRAIAQTTTGVAPSAADSNSSTAYFGASERFKSYEPNYGIWRFIDGDEDDDALTAHYSFRYDFRGGPGVNLYLAYTGEFDFYMGTRESAPVINRLNNPAIHLRSSKDRKFDWKNLQLEWWDLGIEHLSNGQVVDPGALVENPTPDDGNQTVAQMEYERGNLEYFDTLSRGADFGSVEALVKIDNYENVRNGGTIRGRLNLRVKLKCYWNQTTDVTWGQLANKGVNISDYDFVRIILSQQVKWDGWLRELDLGAGWTFGQEFLKTDSWDFTLLFSIGTKDKRVPFYARVHRGPNDIFADYTRSRDSFGIGLLLR